MKMDDFQTPGLGIVLLVARPIYHDNAAPENPSSQGSYDQPHGSSLLYRPTTTRTFTDNRP